MLVFGLCMPFQAWSMTEKSQILLFTSIPFEQQLHSFLSLSTRLSYLLNYWQENRTIKCFSRFFNAFNKCLNAFSKYWEHCIQIIQTHKKNTFIPFGITGQYNGPEWNLNGFKYKWIQRTLFSKVFMVIYLFWSFQCSNN